MVRIATENLIKLVLIWFQGHGLLVVNPKKREKRMGIIVRKQGMGTLFLLMETTLPLRPNEAQQLGQVAGKDINQGLLLCILSLQVIQFLQRGDFTHLLDNLSLLSGIIDLHIDIQLLGPLLEEDHLILGEDQIHVHGTNILLHIIIDLMNGDDHRICIVDLLRHYVGGLHLPCVVGPLHCVEDPHLQCTVGPVRHHATNRQCIPEGDLHLPLVIGLLVIMDILLQENMNC